MPAGLQAWDASGNLVVDLGDFSTRFVVRQNISFPRTTRAVSFNVAGLTGANSFAVVMVASAGAVYKASYAAVTKNGGVDVLYLPTSNPFVDQTLTIEVYVFN
ncbi:hypothetical protein HAZELMIKA_24 [Klebsiella phage vB_KaeD_HazelMika]|nr:hypothetical protein HAZELMIKA_24 [Klebsiella phage vB_KaeD_HazelMika]